MSWILAATSSIPVLSTRRARRVVGARPAPEGGGLPVPPRGGPARAAPADDARIGALTYAGIGVFSPRFFACVANGAVCKLRPLLDAGIPAGRVSGEYHQGQWLDIGTVERLNELNSWLSDPQ